MISMWSFPRLESQTHLFYVNVTQKKEVRINMSDLCDVYFESDVCGKVDQEPRGGEINILEHL